MVRVWDPFVRLFHWSLALSVATAWLSTEEWRSVLEIAGYIAGLLVAARMFWGLLGSRYARFTEFVRPPPTVATYVTEILSGSERRYVGHNPAGGAMIVVLLTAIIATATTGWLLTTDLFWGSRPMALLHSLCGNGVVVLVSAHLMGVVLASWRHRENLVRAMVTGLKRAPGPADIA
jgi:cytochrome b